MASTSEATSAGTRNELMERFCSVTGSDKQKAEQMLEACGWNLEMAVNMHVDSDYRDPAPEQAAVPNGDEEAVRAPIPQTRATLVEDGWHRGGPHIHRGTKRRTHTVFDAFRDFQAESEIAQPAADKKPRRTLEELFRPPLDIMHRGNFDSARDQGQSSNRWLMVNLQDSQEFSCQVLNRDVWSDKKVKEMVSRHFVFWQVYRDSVDGQRYLQFYGPVEFPYVAIIDPTTGEKLDVWNIVDSQSIINCVESFLSEHCSPNGATAIPASTAEDLSLLDVSEEEQLKAALAASLREAGGNADDVDSEVETFESDSQSPKNCTSSIAPVGDAEEDAASEKAKKSYKEFLGSDQDGMSHLILRLPDGKRQQVTWPCSSKLMALVLYAEEIGYNLKEYELVTNYPKRNLCQLDLSKSLRDVDLFPSEMVFIQLKH